MNPSPNNLQDFIYVPYVCTGWYIPARSTTTSHTHTHTPTHTPTHTHTHTHTCNILILFFKKQIYALTAHTQRYKNDNATKQTATATATRISIANKYDTCSYSYSYIFLRCGRNANNVNVRMALLAFTIYALVPSSWITCTYTIPYRYVRHDVALVIRLRMMIKSQSSAKEEDEYSTRTTTVKMMDILALVNQIKSNLRIA